MTRYQDGCTFAAGNPGTTFAPAPESGEVMPLFAPGNPVSGMPCHLYPAAASSRMHAPQYAPVHSCILHNIAVPFPVICY